MPFKSKAQMGAAFAGYLGPEMKEKASEWAQETPDPKALPQHVSKRPPGKALSRARRRGKKPANPRP